MSVSSKLVGRGLLHEARMLAHEPPQLGPDVLQVLAAEQATVAALRKDMDSVAAQVIHG